jgi:hypothetical protein
MAIAAGKGPKTKKLGLKEQAPPLVQRISHSASLHIAVGVTAARRRARGGDCRKPTACPCRPFLCPPPRERRGRQTPPSSTTPPPIRPRLPSHDPHRHQRRGARGDQGDVAARQLLRARAVHPGDADSHGGRNRQFFDLTKQAARPLGPHLSPAVARDLPLSMATVEGGPIQMGRLLFSRRRCGQRRNAFQHTPLDEFTIVTQSPFGEGRVQPTTRLGQ